MFYMKQSKKHEQTLESAQYGLEISFKLVFLICLVFFWQMWEIEDVTIDIADVQTEEQLKSELAGWHNRRLLGSIWKFWWSHFQNRILETAVKVNLR